MTVHFSCIHAELFYNGLGRIIYVFIPFYKLLCKIFVFFPYPLQVAKFISLQ